MKFNNEEQVYEHFLPGYFHEQNDETRDEMWWSAPRTVIVPLLTALQLFKGEGDDCITMDEVSRQYNCSWIQWPDLLSMDIPHWEVNSYLHQNPYDKYAEELDNRNIEPKFIENVPEGYSSQFHHEEIKLFYQGDLHNGEITSAINYVDREATLLISQWAKSFPKNKQRKVNMSWHEHYQTRNEYVMRELELLGPMSIIINHSELCHFLPKVTFILANNMSLRSVSPKHFLRDIKSIENESLLDTLDELVISITQEHKKWYKSEGFLA
ncbi:hypothetical protein BCU68_10895 [Vibrio sp. 10N.286.49.B3]|uniref:hypothetical protein n=1 Tax=Vibrio sp. 10N.286.49.B3 TaxID=1880855 RepID=UPI000C8160FC|nr:hypothetical protein [Vibrio sp. 10N.286.49.B3]PMH45362.1 hypothetical protein BCU68_10895 [Vibrio sp. 10N.286.49.B3]